MKHKATRRAMGITLRAALLSWLVTVTTLLAFVGVIVPQQKRTFLENLESKAHGVAVALREVAAGAAVTENNEDVVAHCTEMLQGDKTLAYLVVTKNDGTSLVHQSGPAGTNVMWSLETLPAEWRPEKREARSRIGEVDLIKRRVFQYSQPFDYSGIQWGWIHVGLSLQSYDRSVTGLYQRTAVLAVLCIVLSLLASAMYARRLVHPILGLRKVVQRVARGDLAARAPMERADELGHLAESVNSMTEALLRRDQILQSVGFAAQQFLSSANWTGAIHAVLAKIGQAATVSRAYVFENVGGEGATLLAQLRCEWPSQPGSGVASECVPPRDYRREGFARWVEVMAGGGGISGVVAELPESERPLLEARGIRSMLAVPIHVEGVWWGFLGLDDCERERVWTDSERDSLRAIADMLGATIARRRAELALVESKETLEVRVAERTRELETQMIAKARAHSELAEAQQRLIELSRQAGMAEVATGVLHNVGNVLNSVNVSVNLLQDGLGRSRLVSLQKTVGLMTQHEADLGTYLTTDPKGQLIPGFLAKLAEVLAAEHAAWMEEVRGLVRNVEHVKEIVAMQQSYARVAGVVEMLAPAQLVEDALRINGAALSRHGIQILRDFAPAPRVAVDRHKVLQILTNLIRNAKYAMDSGPAPERVLQVAIAPSGAGMVRITVRDNGVGIPPENLTRIFSHGFTTKKDGHGFGLHSGALAAREMGGTLEAASDGVGRGATFTLELPVAENPA